MRDLTGHGALTIHRAALGPSPKEDRFMRDEDDPLSNDVELVIVDEASMLSLELADALFRAAGDCHVLLVGDTDQLPPIGPGRVLADLVESDATSRVHLTAIYRQAARSLIVRSARRINGGQPPFLSLAEAHAELGEQALDEDFFWIARSGPETLRETVLELACEALPRRGFDPRTEVMTLVPMRRGIVGLIELNSELEQRLNPHGTPVVRELRVGSRIVQTRNDYTLEREVMNGEIAFVLAWDEEVGEALLSLDDGEREVTVPASALETYQLAWALTIHRAQGSQFPAVIAPWSSQYHVMLSRPLLYTAVTRAQRLCVLAGETPGTADRGHNARGEDGHATHRSPNGSDSARPPRRRLAALSGRALALVSLVPFGDRWPQAVCGKDRLRDGRPSLPVTTVGFPGTGQRLGSRAWFRRGEQGRRWRGGVRRCARVRRLRRVRSLDAGAVPAAYGRLLARATLGAYRLLQDGRVARDLEPV